MTSTLNYYSSEALVILRGHFKNMQGRISPYCHQILTRAEGGKKKATPSSDIDLYKMQKTLHPT